MAQTLDQFVAEETKRLQRFAKYWRCEHAVNAKNFPLHLEDENEWSEQLTTFGDGTDPDLKN